MVFDRGQFWPGGKIHFKNAFQYQNHFWWSYQPVKPTFQITYQYENVGVRLKRPLKVKININSHHDDYIYLYRLIFNHITSRLKRFKNWTFAIIELKDLLWSNMGESNIFWLNRLILPVCHIIYVKRLWVIFYKKPLVLHFQNSPLLRGLSFIWRVQRYFTQH